jgi:hypothetical protein
VPAPKKKHASKMTSDEIAKRVFPAEVHRKLKQAANPDSEPKKNSQDKDK